MSGGSFDYIFSKDARDLVDYMETIERMSDELAKLGYAQDAAKETMVLLLTIRQYEVRIDAMRERLSGVWKAVEWWVSGDSTEENLKEALVKYRGEQL